MMSLSDDKQVGVIDAFNISSRYLDDILNINNVYFDNMVSQIYPSELQLIKPIPLIPKPQFKTCICQFLMILFLPKCMINVTTLILAFCRAHRDLPLDFFCSGIHFYLLLSPYLCFISLLNLDLYVLGDDALIS